MKRINVGLLGYGNVNRNVHELIKHYAGRWGKIYGVQIEVVAVSVKHWDLHLDIVELLVPLETLIACKNVHVIIEAATGTEYASHLLSAMRNGKHIIAANKQLVALHYDELIETATENRVHFLYEAAVGAGIPIIELVRVLSRHQRILNIRAILNGTSNYIIGKLEQGHDLSEAIEEAKQIGIAEKDEWYDISGQDAACKLFILARECKWTLELNQIELEGIDEINHEIISSKDTGKRYKQVCWADNAGLAFVKNQSVLYGDFLYGINHEENGIVITGELSGPIKITGSGAGKQSTASAILQNLFAIVEGGEIFYK